MKTKKTVYSTVIFILVFWVSIIIDIRHPVNSAGVDKTPELELEQPQKEVKHHYYNSALYKADKPRSISNETSSDDTANISVSNQTERDKVELLSLPNNSTSDSHMVTSFSMEEPMAGLANSGFTIEPMDVENIINKIVLESKNHNIGISVAESYVHIRSEPNAESESLGKLHRNSAAEVLDTKDDWYFVDSGGVKGYIKASYLKTDIPYKELIKEYGSLSATILVDGLNVREDTDVDSKRLTVIYVNEKYPVVDVMSEWVKIDVPDDNITGYVSREYIELNADFDEAISREEEEEMLRLQEEERQRKLKAQQEAERQKALVEEKINTKPATEQRGATSYSAEDLKLLACLVHAEAGNEGYEGKLAVANVVLNRLKSGKYPNSLKGVIEQKGQFSVFRSGSLAKQLSKYGNYNSKKQKMSIKAAKDALEGKNNIGSRKSFHAYWLAKQKGYHKSRKNAVKIQNQLFW